MNILLISEESPYFDMLHDLVKLSSSVDLVDISRTLQDGICKSFIHRPDLVLFDLDALHTGPDHFVRQLRQHLPDCTLMGLTDRSLEKLSDRVVAMGADRLVGKCRFVEDILPLIHFSSRAVS